MGFSEDDLLPLSGLQHLIYCERQAALIHVEQIWLDNVWTVEGEYLHEKAISGQSESRGEIRITRNLALRSLRLGLAGRADVVEFHRIRQEGQAGVVLARAEGRWRPHPIEYKRGRPKIHRADETQLCAQALCLEEMLGVDVPSGALFYGKSRRRVEVDFDSALRDLTAATAERFRDLFERAATPPARYEKAKCEKCSLLAACRPRAAEHRVARYLESALWSTVVARP